MLGNCDRSRTVAGSAALTIALLVAIAGPGLASADAEPTAEPMAEPADERADEPVLGPVAGDGAEEEAEASPGPERETLDRERICVRVSTDPPAVGVYEECGSGGSGGVYVDDQRVLGLPSAG